MAEWQFPNAIAESVKRSAELRGQNAHRLEIRDWQDRWPSEVIVERWGTCPRTGGLFVHETPDGQSFCKHCGSLVAGG